jgi:hypothetical protein
MVLSTKIELISIKKQKDKRKQIDYLILMIRRNLNMHQNKREEEPTIEKS